MRDFTGTDRIAVHQRLGSGGFGVVYRGYDRGRRLPVAIKTLKSLDPAGLASFKDEFRALADIAHPNLITLFELLSDGDQWFYTMELVDGVDFLTWVRGGSAWAADASAESTPETETRAVGDSSRSGGAGDTPPQTLDEGRLRRALVQLASGVAALHAAGTLHRDLKPSNVLVTPAGRVVILDFGLAREIPLDGDATRAEPSQLVGTPAYMSPERLRSGASSPAADWYAVGVMLFEALTGRRPFVGSMLDQLVATQHGPPVRPRELAPGVPDDLDALCTDLLERDPVVRPASADVLARLGSAGVGVPAAAPGRSRVFVGRAGELSVLDDAFAATLDSRRPVVVSISGAPGVGKSSLARQFLERVRARTSGAVVLAGRCYETESVPYKAVDSALDALSRYLQQLPVEQAAALLPRDAEALTRLFPVLGSVGAFARAPRRGADVLDAQEQRGRGFSALRELLGRLTDRQPLVLVLDDVQWGDVDSAALLAELLRPPDPPALLLILTFRAREAATSAMLQEFARLVEQMPGLDRRDLPLEDLPPDDARQLASLLVRSDSTSAAGRHVIDEVAAESAGNPLFIAELARHIGHGGTARSGAGPSSLDDVIAARVGTLPAEAQRLLAVIALSGHPIEVPLASAAAGMSDVDERAVALLRSARLIRGTGEIRWRRVAPYHDRIREVVTASISAVEAPALHLRIGEALEASSGTDPERRAFHFERAGAVERAAPLLIEAAERAMRALAFDHSAALIERALALVPPAEPVERRRLHERLGEALGSAGRGARAAEALLVAAKDAPPDDAQELIRQAAHQYLISGHIDEGLDRLRSVLEAVGLRIPSTPRRALLGVLYHRLRLRLRGLDFTRRDESGVPAETRRRLDACWSAASGLANVDAIRGAYFHARHLRMALAAGEPRRIALGCSNMVSQTAIEGLPVRAQVEALMARADALAAESGDPFIVAHNDLACGVAEYLGGRWRAGLERLVRAETVLREQCTGVAWDLDTCHLYRLRTMYLVGDVAAMCARVPRLIEEAQERGDRLGTTMLRSRLANVALLVADAPVEARALCHEGIAAWSRRGFHTEHYFEWVGQTEIDLYEGRGAEAMARVERTWPVLQGSLITRVQIVREQAHDLRGRAATAAAVETSDAAARARLLADAERDAQTLDREGTPLATAFAHGLRASVASIRGDRETALRELDVCERTFAADELVPHAMAARRRRGCLLGGDEGRALAQSSDEWAAGQGIRNPDRFFAMFGV
ncbi:MAG TPA: protein kinase [Vicinamibacterales bacterium]|nr:protein kinase [Vicinamibacterales bacterium]